METVSVLRDVLVEDLRVRMEAHRLSWEMACKARNEGLVKEMRRRIRVWKKTGVLDRTSLGVSLGRWGDPFPWGQPPGAPYYRRSLAFLELGDDTMELDERQVENWVEDIWPWTADWRRTLKELGVM